MEIILLAASGGLMNMEYMQKLFGYVQRHTESVLLGLIVLVYPDFINISRGYQFSFPMLTP